MNKYEVAEEQLEAWHGLPREVRYCKSCVMSNQKPNTSIEHKNAGTKRSYIGFDAEGVCAACRYNEKKLRIDWSKREEDLLRLLDRYRRKDGWYDVIIPCSGGKDSAYAAHILKVKYGMNPLTVTWRPIIYRPVGWQNLSNMIHAGGLDNMLYSPNGQVQALLTRLAYTNLLHPFQPFVLGQKNVGPKFSIHFGIPLVMYGESNVEYGDPASTDEVEMSEIYFSMDQALEETYLGGVSCRDLMKGHGLSLKDLEPYLPIDPNRARKAGTKVHYLGYYLRWDPQECYYYAKEHTGFTPEEERSEGTYCKYSDLDDKIAPVGFYGMHVKFGIGRTMYDASQEVRNGKITREEGVALCRKFDGEYPARHLPEILAYMGISRAEFDAIADRFRSPHLWKKKDGRWALRHPVA
ncbi:MAG: N-acetyl sugar amidotransferase [Elusimicrobia bacterium]|nr:N-acetyl sugar amidotransferase [Elusimicrobiota bacterium]